MEMEMYKTAENILCYKCLSLFEAPEDFLDLLIIRATENRIFAIYCRDCCESFFVEM